ncbi:MAG: desulfoferrodoxin family protein [Suipraeoptans sp.]
MRAFFIDNESGNVVTEVFNSSEAPMQASYKKLKANTSDGATEKHVPVVSVSGNKVDVVVGSVEHPMLEEHFITAIYIETKLGGQLRELKPGDSPKASFVLSEGDSFVAAYEYCNIHGLWKA